VGLRAEEEALLPHQVVAAEVLDSSQAEGLGSMFCFHQERKVVEMAHSKMVAQVKQELLAQ
jgi:hypothetical protein